MARKGAQHFLFVSILRFDVCFKRRRGHRCRSGGSDRRRSPGHGDRPPCQAQARRRGARGVWFVERLDGDCFFLFFFVLRHLLLRHAHLSFSPPPPVLHNQTLLLSHRRPRSPGPRKAALPRDRGLPGPPGDLGREGEVEERRYQQFCFFSVVGVPASGDRGPGRTRRGARRGRRSCRRSRGISCCASFSSFSFSCLRNLH